MVPTYARAMIANYRRMFHEIFGSETFLKDEEIWHICNTVFNDDDNREQDEDRVYAMKDMENKD